MMIRDHATVDADHQTERKVEKMCCVLLMTKERCCVVRLRQIDIQLMLRLHNKVNIVPVVAKADTLTQSELQRLKARVSLA